MLFKKTIVEGVVGAKSPKHNFVTVIVKDDLTVELPLTEYDFLEEGMIVDVEIKVKYVMVKAEPGHSVSNHMNDPSPVQAPKFYDEIVDV